MLNSISVQTVADHLKGQLHKLPHHLAGWQKVQQSIAALERCPWVPLYLKRIVDAMFPLVEFGDNEIVIAGTETDRLNFIDHIIQRYIVACTPVGELYSMDAAATYLGVSYDQIKNWTSRGEGFHPLKGASVGKALYFSAAELEIHQKLRRGRGRPAAERVKTIKQE